MSDMTDTSKEAVEADMAEETEKTMPDWKGFGQAIMEEWWMHGDIEASEKFDLARRFNILEPIPGGFDPESHYDETGEAEAGDPWYQLNRADEQSTSAEGEG